MLRKYYKMMLPETVFGIFIGMEQDYEKYYKV